MINKSSVRKLNTILVVGWLYQLILMYVCGPLIVGQICIVATTWIYRAMSYTIRNLRRYFSFHLKITKTDKFQCVTFALCHVLSPGTVQRIKSSVNFCHRIPAIHEKQWYFLLLFASFNSHWLQEYRSVAHRSWFGVKWWVRPHIPISLCVFSFHPAHLLCSVVFNLAGQLSLRKYRAAL